MHIGNRRRRFNRTLMFANALMVPAALSQRILIRGWHVNVDLADGITGLLYGVMIGLFILGIRQMMRDDDRASC